jgi:Ser/Thr protein kinase RdoA (MazF antagonist)
MTNTTPPLLPQVFDDLSPECVMDAIDSTGLRCDGSLTALNSYENRVYLFGLEEGGQAVAKFYRPRRWSDQAIFEEHAFLRELAEQEIPVVAPLTNAQGTSLHHFQSYRLAIFPRQGGRSPELDDAGVLQRLGRFLGRIHSVGQTRTFQHRATLDIHNFGFAARDYLLEHGFIPADLRSLYVQASSAALESVAACYQRAGEIRLLRLHGDCHLGNILWTDSGPHFVDFDDSRMGPGLQDIWMLLSGTRAEMQSQLADILAGYEDFCDFNPRELYLLEALRTLRLLHYSAWIAQRWQDPAFPPAFPWFNSHVYWQERIQEMQEQHDLMAQAPLW